MAQVTETVARGILAGHGYTDNEVRQLAHHWLASHGQAPAGAAEEIDKALNVYAQAFAARVNGWTRQNGDDLPGARSALFAAIHAYARASTRPAASPQADSVQEDAARYRLLRRGQHWSVIDAIGNDLLRAEALDAAVDAARKRGGL